jgi:hypothetical protein
VGKVREVTKHGKRGWSGAAGRLPCKPNMSNVAPRTAPAPAHARKASSTPARHSTAQHTCAARDQLVAVLHQRVTQGRCIALDLRSQVQACRQ